MDSTASLLLVALLLDCSKPASGANAAPHPALSGSVDSTATTPAPRYAARGTVRSIDAEKGLLWIAHEDIPGYMKAMTMPFVASPALRRGLNPGDHVEFTFHDDGTGSLIIESLVKRP